MSSWYLHSKFWLACAVFVAALVLLLMGRIDAAQWVSTVTWVLGLYCGADVADAVATRPKA